MLKITKLSYKFCIKFSKKIMGMTIFGHFSFQNARFAPLWRAFHTLQGERNWTQPSFHSGTSAPLPSRRERDWTARSTTFPSPPFGLRPKAVILDRAVFASLSRGQSNPLRGFPNSHLPLKQKAKPFGFAFCFKEREGFDDGLTSFRSSPSGLRS